MSTEIIQNQAQAVPTAPVLPKFRAIQGELKATFFERNEQIKGALCALVANQHMFILGPAGTAKSAVVRDICARITATNYFEWLLTKFTTPEEIFGPLSLNALKNDRTARITTAKLPEAHIGFLDETFKANSSILNSLLRIMNERLYDNDGKPTMVPLLSMFGASNELPDSEELGPFYDRFLLRFVVKYIESEANFKQMLTAAPISNPTTLTLDEIRQAQVEAAAILFPDAVLDTLLGVRQKANSEGIIASDRRYKQSMSVLRAHAWLAGRSVVTDEDLTMLAYILPDTPAQHTIVRKIVIEVANPVMSKVQELVDTAQEIDHKSKQKVQNASDDEKATVKSAVGTEATIKYKQILTELRSMEAAQKAEGKSTDMIDEAVKQVEVLQKGVMKDVFGLEF